MHTSLYIYIYIYVCIYIYIYIFRYIYKVFWFRAFVRVSHLGFSRPLPRPQSACKVAPYPVYCRLRPGNLRQSHAASAAQVTIISEPSWHRRARQCRSDARRFLKIQKARQLLNSHHGSTAPTMPLYDEWHTVGKGRGNQRFVTENGQMQYNGKVGGKGGNQFQYVHSQPQQVLQQQQQQFPQQHPQQQYGPYQQQPQQLQQWHPTRPGDWACLSCNSLHRHYHQSCWTCEALLAHSKGKAAGKGKGKGGKSTAQQAQQQQQPKQRPGRWNRQRWKSGPGAPAHWGTKNNPNKQKEAAGDDEMMGDEDVGLVTTSPPPLAKSLTLTMTRLICFSRGSSQRVPAPRCWVS